MMLQAQFVQLEQDAFEAMHSILNVAHSVPQHGLVKLMSPDLMDSVEV